MASINVLSPALASQIAAGEVVERPASATKELIENALDAKASRCDTSCVGGGVEELCVRDDGIGMSEEDAALCIERHATSKLTQISDLGSLATFGFRGEALPSIASVSRFSLRTRPQALDYGCCVEVVGGKSPSFRREGMPVGTTVIVRDLFFNVPARRKFLRSTGTESAHISAVVEGAALARPDVTFTLERDGRRVKELLRTGSRRERVLQLLGDELLTEVRGERGPLRLEAHLSRPERARPGATGLWLLVNGRVVRDRMIAATVAQAYGPALATGTYPRGVVYLELPSELVDVNVHPQKTEVRFVDARALGDAVFSITSKAVSSAFNLPTVTRGARHQPTRSNSAHANLLPVERGFVPGETRATDRPAIDPWTNVDPTEAAEPRFEPPPLDLSAGRRQVEDAAIAAHACEPDPHEQGVTLLDASAPRRAVVPRNGLSPSLVGAALTNSARNLVQPAASAAQSPVEPDEPAPATMLNPPLEFFGAVAPVQLASIVNVEHTPLDGEANDTTGMRLLGQVRRSMLVCEGRHGLYVFDQHVLDECVLCAKYLAQFRSDSTPSEALLFPAVIEVHPKQLEIVERQPELLARLGLELRIRGKDRVSIHAVPKVLKRASAERLVRDALIELADASGGDLEARAKRAMANMACDAAVRSGETLSSSEMEALVAGVDENSIPTRTKHGRPLLTKLEWHELERNIVRHLE